MRGRLDGDGAAAFGAPLFAFPNVISAAQTQAVAAAISTDSAAAGQEQGGDGEDEAENRWRVKRNSDSA